MKDKLEDPSTRRALCLRGSMKHERLHQQEFPTAGNTFYLPVPGHQFLHFTTTQDALKMSAGGNPQRSIPGMAVVDVQPGGQQGFKHMSRRSRVINPIFDRRQLESFSLHGLGEGKHHILMPAHLPVGRRCLVKSNRLNGHCILRKVTGCDESQENALRSIRDEWRIEQASCARHALLKSRLSEAVE